MEFFLNKDITRYNTFQLPATAESFVVIESPEQIPEAIEKYWTPEHILWWGSNLLIVTDKIQWVIFHLECKGITTQPHPSEENTILLTAMAGEIRDDLVKHTIKEWLRGIENLVAIPWTVWASPVQNIGAYWVELKDIFFSCKAYDLENKEFKTFSKDDCQFGYRSSTFKTHSGRYIITEVTLALNNVAKPIISYWWVEKALEERWFSTPSQEQIAQTIEAIRWEKLPNPLEIGNAWSFFKNPILTTPTEKENFKSILETYPDVPHFISDTMDIKIPAARLIEKAGWKWIRQWAVWTHPKQPLIIVNYWGATGKDVFDFSEQIIQKVYETFWIQLEREVNIW